MGEITPELQKNIFKLMELKYNKHKKIMLWTWFFIMLYTIAVFVVLVQYVYKNMFVKLNFFFVEIGYDVWGCFWLLTIFYFLFLDITFSLKRLSGSKMDIKILVSSLKNYYLLFNFFLIFPALFTAVFDFPFFGNIGKIVLGVSPILFYFMRFFIVDFIGSGRIVRKIFRSKDVNIRSCPSCHEYILKKPNVYCPNCGNRKGINRKFGINKLCDDCGFSLKINDFDFPKCCPHCGLRFK